ncbi:MAG TPA: hypothetical protein VIY68_09565 [Steroidobacteraceae bacterium]
MSIFRRTFVVSLLLWALAPAACCASNSTVNNNVIVLRDTVIALTGDPDINPTIDMLAAVQVRIVGAKDSTWKEDNPNWMQVYNIVHDDLSRDVGLLLQAQVRDTAAHWDHELPAHLTPSQIDELVKFFHSEVGLRYLAFQKQLIAVQQDVLSVSVVGRASADPDPHRVAVAATAAQIESRKSVAALSWVYLMLTALGPSGSPGRNASANDDKTIHDMLIDALATVRGPELDQLKAQYHADLPAFATFTESPVAKALISVYGFVTKDVQADPKAPGIAFATALQRSIEQHTPEWKAAYEAGRAGAH